MQTYEFVSDMFCYINQLTTNVPFTQKAINWFAEQLTSSHLTFTCSKSTKEKLEKGMKYVQSQL